MPYAGTVLVTVNGIQPFVEARLNYFELAPLSSPNPHPDHAQFVANTQNLSSPFALSLKKPSEDLAA